MALLGKRGPKRHKPEISTFHSLCVRVLRRNIARLGYPPTFSIYDGQEQESIARAVLRDLRVGNEKLRPGDLLGFVGRWKTRGTRPEGAEEASKGDKELLAATAYGRYQAALRAAGAVDFDDLLLCTEELFERLLSTRSDLGLLAEEWDPASRRQLGNFPQAFTHVALVNSAFNLDRQHHATPEQRAQPSGY